MERNETERGTTFLHPNHPATKRLALDAAAANMDHLYACTCCGKRVSEVVEPANWIGGPVGWEDARVRFDCLSDDCDGEVNTMEPDAFEILTDARRRDWGRRHG